MAETAVFICIFMLLAQYSIKLLYKHSNQNRLVTTMFDMLLQVNLTLVSASKFAELTQLSEPRTDMIYE